MGTIQSAIKLFDGYSPVIRNMIQVNQKIISSFAATEQASGRVFNLQALREAQSLLGRVEVDFDAVEKEIQEAANAQNRLNNRMKNGKDAADGLKNKLLGIAASVGAALSAKKIIDLTDSMTGTNARLNLIVDDGGSVEELQDKIMASANRGRAAYLDTANAVAKLGVLAGDAFKDNDEIIAFTEQLNKQFVIGGSSIQESSNAMYQLSQAMAAGRLQGDEFRSIMENAPMLAQSIAAYMGKTTGELRKMSSEGLITADVIKNALLGSAEETNAALEKMPKTWGQLWTRAKNDFLQAFEPLIQWLGSAASWIYDNWATIGPIFYGVATAIGIVAGAFAILTAATWIHTTAQWALNSALLASPLTWIVLAIAAIVGVIMWWINAMGGLQIAWLTVCNVLQVVWDTVVIAFLTGVYWVIDLWEQMKFGMQAAGTAIANFMGQMKADVLSILESMVNGAINIINGFISTLNALPGVEIGVIEQVTFGAMAQYTNEIETRNRNAQLDYDEAAMRKGIADRQTDLANRMTAAREGAASRWDHINTLKAQKAAGGGGSSDLAAGLGDAGDTWNEIAQGVGGTAGNTGRMADSMEIAEEDLKYLRDVAERETINRYTTAEIVITQNNENHINSELDLDGVVGYLNDGVAEAIDLATEGDHV